MIKDTDFVLKLLQEYSMASAGQIAEAQDAAFDSGSGDVIGELIKKGFGIL